MASDAEDPYTRNLLRNSDAMNGVAYWERTGDVDVEETPSGANSIKESIPGVEGMVRNWVTSHTYGALEQKVKLLDAGCSEAILDKLRPPIPIYASVWCAARSDCGAKFNMKVQLLDEDDKVLKTEEREKVLEAAELRKDWHKVEAIFTDYEPGVRSVVFHMGGVDTKYWAGYYGAKFTLPCVRFAFIN